MRFTKPRSLNFRTPQFNTHQLKSLCTPSLIYFVIAMVSYIFVILQNVTSNSPMLQIGVMNMNVPNTLLVYIIKFIYILFWTWILNLMCKDGHSEISWLFIMVPFILVFL